MDDGFDENDDDDVYEDCELNDFGTWKDESWNEDDGDPVVKLCAAVSCLKTSNSFESDDDNFDDDDDVDDEENFDAWKKLTEFKKCDASDLWNCIFSNRSLDFSAPSQFCQLQKASLLINAFSFFLTAYPRACEIVALGWLIAHLEWITLPLVKGAKKKLIALKKSVREIYIKAMTYKTCQNIIIPALSNRNDLVLNEEQSLSPLAGAALLSKCTFEGRDFTDFSEIGWRAGGRSKVLKEVNNNDAKMFCKDRRGVIYRPFLGSFFFDGVTYCMPGQWLLNAMNAEDEEEEEGYDSEG